MNLTLIYEDIQNNGIYYGSKGAGVLFYCKSTNKILLGLRSAQANESGTWGIIGGSIEEKEDPIEAAHREVCEELNLKKCNLPLKLIYIYNRSNFQYYNYLCEVSSEFKPIKNWEHDKLEWFDINKLPSNIHYGVKHLLPNFKKLIENEST
jgi:8-oxo-dGTP pyrophosphatase MutT (NUDIX family)